jgi:hypothetical protein
LLILPLAFCIPPWIASKQTLCMVTLPIITASLIHAWIVMGGIDVISFDLLLHAYHLLLFNDPRRDFKRMIEIPKTVLVKTQTSGLDNTGKDEPTTKYIEQPYPTKWSERLPWIGTLLISMRFIDWKIASPSHDTKQPARHPHPPSHFRFISTAVLRTITGYIVMDLTSAWTQQDPYFKTFGVGVDSALPGSTGLSRLWHCRSGHQWANNSNSLVFYQWYCITLAISLMHGPLISGHPSSALLPLSLLLPLLLLLSVAFGVGIGIRLYVSIVRVLVCGVRINSICAERVGRDMLC